MNTALNYQPEVLVDTADLSREDWLDYRRLGIGGSDAAAIMGLSPFSTIRDLYFDKIGVTPVIEEEEENWVANEVGHRLEARSLEKYLKLSEEKSQLEKRKKKIEAEQRALSVPFVELLGQGCKAVIEDGSFRYRITYNPTIRTQIGKENMEKLKNQHPDIYEEYTSTTESRIFRIKKEVA